jgi:hypothetical protein
MGHFYDAIFQRFQRTLGVASTAAKLQTYAQDAGQEDLVEMFVLFGDPATRLGIPAPPERVTLGGPTTGEVNTAYSFTAVAEASTQPLQYTWEATDQATVINADGGTEDRVTFSWDTPGEKMLTVTVTNTWGRATATHTIVIAEPGDPPQPDPTPEPDPTADPDPTPQPDPTPEPGPEPRDTLSVYLPLVINELE